MVSFQHKFSFPRKWIYGLLQRSCSNVFPVLICFVLFCPDPSCPLLRSHAVLAEQLTSSAGLLPVVVQRALLTPSVNCSMTSGRTEVCCPNSKNCPLLLPLFLRFHHPFAIYIPYNARLLSLSLSTPPTAEQDTFLSQWKKLFKSITSRAITRNTLSFRKLKQSLTVAFPFSISESLLGCNKRTRIKGAISNKMPPTSLLFVNNMHYSSGEKMYNPSFTVQMLLSVLPSGSRKQSRTIHYLDFGLP